jgi:tRNA pseudouridine38-40 synthase
VSMGYFFRDMRNIKLTISYDGSKYAGWQRQTSRHTSDIRRQTKTIQETIEKVLQKILREKIHLIGSGRTDAGVHALAQVANFKTSNSIELFKLKGALNGLLPKDICIVKIEETETDFHSRFVAKTKRYAYLILNNDLKPVFHTSLAWAVRQPLDVNAMRREARCLLGKHDFKSFQAHDRAERNSVTTIKRIEVKRGKGGLYFPFLKGQEFVRIEIEAEGFLRHMVRNIIGTLIEIGRGRLDKGELEMILKKKDRKWAGPCAPARGLYLLVVSYD